MTENTDRLRAVLLAALMVFSVFAGTVAFSGSVAAEATDVSATSTSTGTASTTITIANASHPGTENLGYVIDANGDGFQNQTDVVGGGPAEGDGSTDFTQGVGGLSAGTYTVYAANASAPGSGDLSAWADVTTTFTIISQGGVTKSSADTTVDSGSLRWQGQTVFFKGEGDDAGAEFQLRRVTSSGTEFATTVPLDSNSEAVIALTEANIGGTGEFVLVDETGANVTVDADGNHSGTTGQADASFEVHTQSFGADVDRDSVVDDNTKGTSATDVTFSSNRGSFDVIVSWESDSSAEVSDLVGAFGGSAYDLDADGESDSVELTGITKGQTVAPDFHQVPPGTFNFTFMVEDTGVSAEDSLDVNEAGASDASFASGIQRVSRGDIALIAIDGRTRTPSTATSGARASTTA